LYLPIFLSIVPARSENFTPELEVAGDMASRTLTPDGPKPADGSGAESGFPTWARALVAIAALYLFIASVKMIGGGLKVIAHEPAGDEFLNWLFGLVHDPFTGLVVGILITALVQSSSFTTSMIVTFVAAGTLSVSDAIPIIMGANIGTSITGLLVSLGRLKHRDEFRRSLSAASCHDFFNLMSVSLFFPLELKFGVISRPVSWIANQLGDTKVFSAKPTDHISFIKTFLGAPSNFLKTVLTKWMPSWEWLPDWLRPSTITSGAIMAIVAMILLFVALGLLVKMLRGLVQGKLSGVFSKTLFYNGATAFVVGILMTVSVQSSSVTTSLIVPLVGAEVLTLTQVFPYLLGANIGTTVTALLAALALGSAGAVACACGHLIFNLYGTAVFWPLKALPLGVARWFGELAARRRWLAVVYILVLFFVIPGGILGIMKYTGKLKGEADTTSQTTTIEDGATDVSQETLAPVTE
jgi:solute carrier family 34 (sodium-dependent phosphate cotransporter)